MAQMALNGNGHASPSPPMFPAFAVPTPQFLPTLATITTPYGALTITFATITPETAQMLVDGMSGNRNPHRRQVEQLTRAMKNGDFTFNGEPIILGSNGCMIDGQHRCLACIAAGEPFETLVISGVNLEAFDTMGQSARRTAGDVFAISGVPYANLTAAMVRLIGAHNERKGMWNNSNFAPSPRELERYREKLGDLSRHAHVGSKAGHVAKCPPAFLAAMHYLFCQKDTSLADKFFEQLTLGLHLSENDPVQKLRLRLTMNAKTRRSSSSLAENYALFVNAWNAMRRGKKLTVLRGIYDGIVPEII